MAIKKGTLKKINELALNITEYDICDIGSFETPEEAIQSHLDWLESHYTDISQRFEQETAKYREDF